MPAADIHKSKKEAKTEEPVTSSTAEETSAVTESPVAAPSEERPTIEKKRRTSLFNSFGTGKDKKATEPTSETDATKAETKKSPIPQKLGGLFRRPSKAVKSEETQTGPTSVATETAPAAETTEGGVAPVAKDEPALTNGTPEAPKESTEPVPENITTSTPEVKASA
jgi:hypothetical protein